jgi:CheY-like chemotaxis protein
MIQPLPDTAESVLPAPLLVVEDEPPMQSRLRTILAALGYGDDAIWFAGSLEAANTLLATQPFAMALVDVGLPDGNGIDLIRVMHEQDPALPILVISTWNTERVIVSALQAGATGYLLKERDDVEIILSIRSALRWRADRPLRGQAHSRSGWKDGAAGWRRGSPGRADGRCAATERAGNRNPLAGKQGSDQSGNCGGAVLIKVDGRMPYQKHIQETGSSLRTQAVFEARASGLLR